MGNRTFSFFRLWLLIAGSLVCSSPCLAAELLLPQGKSAFYADEAIEIAVVGLAKDASAEVDLLPPDGRGLSKISFKAVGDGSTVNYALPPLALAPGAYAVHLDGKETPLKITVSAGIESSTMLFSNAVAPEQVRAQGGNFIVGNVGGTGLYTADGQIERQNLRRPSALGAYEKSTALDLPQVIYLYWTGYVTHKPWGTRKSWAEPSMSETMRLFNFHTAQRLRKFQHNVHAIGTIDEPGLPWGMTPAGGSATGFPNWDERRYYESRGWSYTDNPPARDDADWQKYMLIRNGIIGEQQKQAAKDLKTVLPNLTFATDNYAVHVFGDGADAMNQAANDIPTTHVFLDWGYGRMAAVSSVYIEKCNNPLAPVAHAMNGQLIGAPMPSEVQRDCYRGMANSLLMAGLHSNWWLNAGAISNEHLASIHEPLLRVGPLFAEMRPAKHDIAILWSPTEMYARGKSIAARDAQKKDGEQIKIMIASLPENTAVKNNYEMEVSLYTVGQNYREQIIQAHQALTRGGFPAHILHERLLPTGILSRYQTLVIIGQTAEFPPDVRKAIEDFEAHGMHIIVDHTTTVPFKNAGATEADFKDPAFRWTPLFTLADKKPSPFKTPKEGSYFQTNWFMDEPSRKAVAPMVAAAKAAGAKPAFTSDSTDLLFERHIGGDGALYMVLNGHEQLPAIADDQLYQPWNYSPYSATYTLKGLHPADTVWCIEGTDWKTITKVQNPDQPIKGDFAAGEMKLYLVAPHEPTEIDLVAKIVSGSMHVEGLFKDLKMPWPLAVTLFDPDGKALFTVHRAMNADGKYFESFPLGSNAPRGRYSVKVQSVIGDLSAERGDVLNPAPAAATVLAAAVRVHDARAIADFLAARPVVTIALANDRYKPAAEKLWQDLAMRGVKVTIAKEETLWRKARYPRVFDPYIKLFKAEGDETKPDGMKVSTALNLETTEDGVLSAIDAAGKDFSDAWREQSNTLATVTGKGFIDYNAADGEEMYEPGCKIYINDKKQLVPVFAKLTQLKATPENREKWSRPWHKLASYQGAYNLTPQLPEAYEAADHLILLGDCKTSELVAALQASELLPQVADEKYPGSGKALVSFAWSPFAVERNVIVIAATDDAGIKVGAEKVAELATPR